MSLSKVPSTTTDCKEPTVAVQEHSNSVSQNYSGMTDKAILRYCIFPYGDKLSQEKL